MGPRPHMAVYIWINIGSDNMHQTITWTNFELSSVSSLVIYQRAVSGNANIADWNVFEYYTFEITATPPRDHWVKIWEIYIFWRTFHLCFSFRFALRTTLPSLKTVLSCWPVFLAPSKKSRRWWQKGATHHCQCTMCRKLRNEMLETEHFHVNELTNKSCLNITKIITKSCWYSSHSNWAIAKLVFYFKALECQEIKNKSSDGPVTVTINTDVECIPVIHWVWKKDGIQVWYWTMCLYIEYQCGIDHLVAIAGVTVLVPYHVVKTATQMKIGHP